MGKLVGLVAIFPRMLKDVYPKSKTPVKNVTVLIYYFPHKIIYLRIP